jgi:hypothetical protein
MTKTKKPGARELPLVKRPIAALLEKTEANGYTPGEAAAAFEKAEELVAKYKLDPAAFQWPPRPSTPFGSASLSPSASKPPRPSAPGRAKGIGRLAERLIVEHPDWTYRRIAEEVNARIEGRRPARSPSDGTLAGCAGKAGTSLTGGKTQTDSWAGLHVLVGIVRAACFTVFYRNHSQ